MRWREPGPGGYASSREPRLPVARGALLGAVCTVLAAIGFSSKGVIAKLIYAHDVAPDPITLITLRMLFSLPVFLAVAWYLGRPQAAAWRGRAVWKLSALSVLGYYLAPVLDFWGLVYLSASLERLILYLYPTFVVALSVFVERRPVGRAELGGLLLSYAGVAAAVGGEVRFGADVGFGVALVLGSAAAFALFLAKSADPIAQLGSMRFTCYTMIIATAATAVHFAAAHDWAALTVFPPAVYGLIALMTLFATVLPVFLMSAGLRRLGASRASIIGSIGPISTLALGYGVLNEVLTPLQLAGAALVIAGVVLTVHAASGRPPVELTSRETPV